VHKKLSLHDNDFVHLNLCISQVFKPFPLAAGRSICSGKQTILLFNHIFLRT